MEVLTNKLAELLQVGVDGATKAYPVLREQYIWYRAFGYVNQVTSIISVVSVIASVLVVFIMMMVAGDGEEIESLIKKVLKVVMIVTAVSIGLYTVSGISKAVLAPDIMMILEML